MQKLRYKSGEFTLQVSLDIAESHYISKNTPIKITFQWERKDPYFGYRASWDEKNGKKCWISPIIRMYCGAPENYETINNYAIAYTSKNCIERVITRVHQEWREFHMKREQAFKDLSEICAPPPQE